MHLFKIYEVVQLVQLDNCHLPTGIIHNIACQDIRKLYLMHLIYPEKKVIIRVRVNHPNLMDYINLSVKFLISDTSSLMMNRPNQFGSVPPVRQAFVPMYK